MADSNTIAAAPVISVPFQGVTLFVVDHEGEPFTPLKPIVEGMGLIWSGQFEKVKGNDKRWGVRVIRIPSEGGEQEATCLPLRKLAGWFASLQPSRLKPEIREKVIAYQNECDDVLWKYWTEGRVERADKAIDAAQAGELATRIAERFPEGKHRPYAWSRFNNHFRISGYKTLPASKFDEACAYIDQLPIKGSAAVSEVADRAEAVQVVLERVRHARFHLTFGDNGEMHLVEIPRNARVLSDEEIATVLREPGEIPLKELPNIIAAAAERLKLAA